MAKLYVLWNHSLWAKF